MFEKNVILKKKRNPLQIEIPNKEITFCDTKKYIKYNIEDLNQTNSNNDMIFKKNSEDYYESNVYNEPICKDKFFFGNKYYDKKPSLLKSNSELFNKNKQLFFKKNLISNYFEKNFEMKSKLNLSFENNNQKFILDNEKELNENKSENYINLRKIINLFSFICKKRKNEKEKLSSENNIFDYDSNQIQNFQKKNSIKFSKRFYKNLTTTENIKNSFPVHKRNITELYIDLEKGVPSNKIIRINNINNNISKKGGKKTIPRKINYKMYDAYIMNSEFNESFEKEKKKILKGSHLNSSMRKININLNENSIDKKIYLNKSKIKNHSINYSNPKKYKSDKGIKTIINNYMNRERDSNYNIIYKAKKKEETGLHKIIKKRVILEEEYLVNTEGDEKLLSIRRLEDKNNNEKSNNSHFIKKNFIQEKTINNENPMNKKYKLNNSFFASIFKDNSRKTVSNKRLGIKVTDDINKMSFIFNNHQKSKNYYKKTKNSITKPSLLRNTNNKLSSKNIAKDLNKLPIKTDLKEKQIREQKINKEQNNKEKNIKKQLFYNRIYLNKINKNNNNSKMNMYQNHLRSNTKSINYLEDKISSKCEKSNSIYNKISFSKKQPFMIYHNEEKNQTFYINNNQSCSNMVNIVFLNNEKNKKYKEIDRPNAVCGLKRNNYKFHEIKSISIDNNNNISGIKSTRNYVNKNIINVSSYDDPIENKKNNYCIYSSMDNMNDKRIKNLPIYEYISSRPKLRIDNYKNRYINKSGFNKSGTSQYFIDYNE